MRRNPWRTTLTIALVAVLFFWILTASDYSESAATGTFRFTSPGVQSTLTLRPDHTFHQVLVTANHQQESDGTWRLIGQGQIDLSSQLLTVPGQERSPDGSTYATMDKLFGLFTTLSMQQYNVLWFAKSDGSGDALAGTYTNDQTTLTLAPDHTFTETFGPRSSHGTWSQTNQRITFSPGFFNAGGNPLDPEESAFVRDPRDGHMQVEIVRKGSPIFRKRYFFQP